MIGAFGETAQRAGVPREASLACRSECSGVKNAPPGEHVVVLYLRSCREKRENMDIILIVLNFVARYPMLRMGVMLIGLAFLIGLWASVWSAYIPAKSLYRAPRGKQAAKTSLSRIRQQLGEGSGEWLFYEEELYYISDFDELSEQEREIYARALRRLDNGGKYAGQIGTRVYLPNRREARKYLHFIESNASVGAGRD